jgi:hypothetical protein
MTVVARAAFLTTRFGGYLHGEVPEEDAEHPTGLCRDTGMVIPTYCNDTVICMPPDGDPAVDRRRMRETGRRLADGYLRNPPLLTNARCSPELSAATARQAGEI